MSLRPRAVNFDETLAKIRETLESVVTLKKIPRAVWNDRFSYPFAFQEMQRIICHDMHFLVYSGEILIAVMATFCHHSDCSAIKLQCCLNFIHQLKAIDKSKSYTCSYKMSGNFPNVACHYLWYLIL